MSLPTRTKRVKRKPTENTVDNDHNWQLSKRTNQTHRQLRRIHNCCQISFSLF